MPGQNSKFPFLICARLSKEVSFLIEKKKKRLDVSRQGSKVRNLLCSLFSQPDAWAPSKTKSKPMLESWGIWATWLTWHSQVESCHWGTTMAGILRFQREGTKSFYKWAGVTKHDHLEGSSNLFRKWVPSSSIYPKHITLKQQLSFYRSHSQSCLLFASLWCRMLQCYSALIKCYFFCAAFYTEVARLVFWRRDLYIHAFGAYIRSCCLYQKLLFFFADFRSNSSLFLDPQQFYISRLYKIYSYSKKTSQLCFISDMLIDHLRDDGKLCVWDRKLYVSNFFAQRTMLCRQFQ